MIRCPLDQKFRKSERLRLKREFDRLKKSGKVVRYEDLILIYDENSLGFNRLGVTVRRGFGKSYRRNKFKRYVREIFRKNKCKLKKGYDLLIMPKVDMGKYFEEMRYDDFEVKLFELFRKANLVVE